VFSRVRRRRRHFRASLRPRVPHLLLLLLLGIVPVLLLLVTVEDVPVLAVLVDARLLPADLPRSTVSSSSPGKESALLVSEPGLWPPLLYDPLEDALEESDKGSEPGGVGAPPRRTPPPRTLTFPPS
jgi:hypothetical protein